MSYWVHMAVLTQKMIPGKFPGKFLPGKPNSGSFFPDFGKIPEIENFNFEIEKVAMEKIGRNVKYSYIGPLFAGKGFRGLSQNWWFLWAPDRFGRFGSEQFSAFRFPADFLIMSRNHAWVPPHQIFLEGEERGLSYG